MIKAAAEGNKNIANFLFNICRFYKHDTWELLLVGCTPVFFAAINHSIEMIQWLVEKGAHINCQDMNGNAPLHWAAAPVYCKMRLHYKIEEKTTCNFYEGPQFRPRIIKWLIEEQGSDINVQNKYGETILHFFIAFRDLEWVQWLLKKGANINLKCANGDTLMHWAVRCDALEVIRLLVNHSKSINDNKNTFKNLIVTCNNFRETPST